MKHQQFTPTPAPAYQLLPLCVRAVQGSGQPIVLRAIGYRIEGRLEITIYQGHSWVNSFRDTPANALAGIVTFARSIQAAGVPCRLTLLIHPASLPF